MWRARTKHDSNLDGGKKKKKKRRGKKLGSPRLGKQMTTERTHNASLLCIVVERARDRDRRCCVAVQNGQI